MGSSCVRSGVPYCVSVMKSDMEKKRSIPTVPSGHVVLASWFFFCVYIYKHATHQVGMYYVDSWWSCPFRLILELGSKTPLARLLKAFFWWTAQQDRDFPKQISCIKCQEQLSLTTNPTTIMDRNCHQKSVVCVSFVVVSSLKTRIQTNR